jgi:RHS repeat-associated protein
VLTAGFAAIGQVSPAWAAPTDPARIPESVLDQLPGRKAHAPSALAVEMARQQAQLEEMVNQAEEGPQPASSASLSAGAAREPSERSAGRSMAWRAKLHELRTKLRGMDDDATVPAALRPALRDRLSKLIARIQAVSEARTTEERRHAREQAKALLAQLRANTPTNVTFPRTGWEASQPSPARLVHDGKAVAPRPGGVSPSPARVVLAMNSNDAIQLAAVLPAPLEASVCQYQSADLADDGRNVVLSSEIRALAQELDYSPARISQWVRQEIRFEPYFGAAKGSQATYLARSGGPFDIASLTIALLRASNIPARYVSGQITVDDDARSNETGRLPRWLGVKSYQAAKAVLDQGHFPSVGYYPDAANETTARGLSFRHVWVNACVPYAHYRGSRADGVGQTWIPLDPSFRLPTNIQLGQPATTVDLDYATYLAKRGLVLPAERYEELVAQYAAGLNPPRTIDQIPYRGSELPFKFDVLPAALPYTVVGLSDWNGSGFADIAVLPDAYQYRVNIALRNSASQSLGTPPDLYLPAIALKRLTLGFEAAANDAATATKLANWRTDNSGTSTLSCPTNVVPQIRVDGTSHWKGAIAVNTCDPAANQLDIKLFLDALTDSQSAGPLLENSASYTNIAAGNLHALQIDAHQQSAALLDSRIQQLLAGERSTTNPNLNVDGIEGEFLHIVGLKYMWHVNESARRIGELSGTSGQTGFSIGLTSTLSKVEYAFDLPLGLLRSGYIIDMPAQLSKSVDLATGTPSYAPFKLWVVDGSALESYIWQENARLDAVSTVRGIQYATESPQNIQTLTLTSANWTSQKALLTSNTDATLNFTTAEVGSLGNTYFCGTCQPYTVTMPRSKIRYGTGSGSWLGYVLSAEYNQLAQSGNARVTNAIQGGYNGGYANPIPVDLTSFSALLGTGFAYSSPPATSIYSNWSSPVYAPPATISSAVGLGSSIYNSYAGDPVNLVNGNVYHNEQDIRIKGRGGLDFVLERSYNSRDAKDGPLGFGWTHSMNQYLLFSSDNPDEATGADDFDNIVSSIVWVDGTGSRKAIVSNGGATTFTTPKGYFFQVTRQGDNTFLVTENGGVKYTFENKTAAVPANDAAAFANRARLVRIEDRYGNALTLSYTAAANCNGTYVCKVTDGLNRSLTFAYNGTGRLDTIADWTGRQWKYGYDAAGNLLSYRSPRAAAGKQAGVSYAYYGAADGANLDHALKSYTLPRGNGMVFEYYMNGRAFRHYPIGHVDEVVSFTYNDFRRETIVTDARGNDTHHFFDQYGNPAQIKMPDAGVRTYAYDCRSTTDCPNPYNKLSEVDPTGLTINYAYDTAGNLTQTSFPAAGTSVARYDFGSNTYAQPRRIKDVRGNWTVLRYDAKGNPTDAIQLKVGVTPAACSSECAIPAAANIVAWTQKQYDGYGNVTQLKRVRDFSTQAGPTLATDYNDTLNGVVGLNAVKVTRLGDKTGDGIVDGNDPADVANLSYDSLGRVKQGIDEAWYAFAVDVYDEVDRSVKTTDALGRRIEVDYDANGNIAERRLVGGSQTVRRGFAYDDSDRLLGETDNAGNATRHEYDAAGNRTATTDPDGWRVVFQRDALDRVTEAADGEGNFTQTDFDIGGREVRHIDPLGVAITRGYYGADKQGRLKSVGLPAIQSEAAGRGVEYDYDAAGNVVTQSAVGSDGAKRTHLRFYDELNRPVREVGPLVGSAHRQICRQYGSLGDLSSLWVGPTADTTSTTCNFGDAALKKQATYLYDDFGRMLKETDPLSRVRSWTFDVHGQVLTAKDAKNQTTTYTYEADGSPATRQDSAGHIATWSYDALHRLQSLGDANTTYTYAYDTAQRLHSIADSRGGKTLTYDYSPGGLLNWFSDSEGRRTDYLYDGAGRLIGQWLPNGEYLVWSYDADGRLGRRNGANGTVVDYKWNADGSLSGVSSVIDGTQLAASHAYHYNPFGQRDQVQDTINGSLFKWRHAYDALGRLSASYIATNSGAEGLYRSWGYDDSASWGDIVRTGYSNGTYQVPVYDAAHQIQRIEAYTAAGVLQGYAATFSHDANGSMLTKVSGGATLAYTWDELNRPATAILSGASSGSLAYLHDAMDRRIGKTVNGTRLDYLLDGAGGLAGIHAEYSGGWTQPQTLIAHGGVDAPLARLPVSGAGYGAMQMQHPDALGSITALTTDNGAAADTLNFVVTYDPWGAFASAGGTAATDLYGFQGHRRDEVGVYDFRARLYDPAIGRFVSRDPLGHGGGLSLYAGFDNDPVDNTDPTGTTALASGVRGLIAQSYYDSVTGALGLGKLSSGQQSLATVSYRPSPYQQSTTATVQTALNVASAIPVVGIPFSLASAAFDVDAGNYGSAGLSLAGAIPFVGSVRGVAKTADILLDAARVEQSVARAAPTTLENVVANGIGFDSSRQLRSAMAPGAGEQIHHIVEQTPGNLAAFGAQAIHNTANAVPVAASTHIGKGSISAYYSGIDRNFSETMIVRKWLSGQSYDDQYQFGLDTLRRFGVLQ